MMLPDKLEKLCNTAIDLMQADAQKAASPAFTSFQSAAEAEQSAATSANKKEEFTKHFVEAVRGRFAEILESKKTDKTATKKKLSKKEEMDERISKYSLLSTEEMDVQIASEMQTRILQTEQRFPLSCLSMRIEKVAGRPFLLSACPMHPQHLATAFKQSVDKVNDNKRMTAAAMQAWVKQLKAAYPGWLEALNQQLIKQLILPDLDESDISNRYKNSIEAQKAKSKEIRQNVISEITGKKTEEAGAVLPKELMASLSTLLKKAAVDNPDLQPHMVTGSQKGPAIDTEDVVKTLHNVKPEVVVNEQTGYRELTNEKSLAEMIKMTTNLSSFMLNEQTQNAIAMMSMMFSKMNQEESLAAPMKPLLSDLQMPMLKRALKDDKFFMDTENPAQQLVNEIARAGSQWTPTNNANRDIFYKKMVAIVDDVKEKHEEDEDIFENKLGELNEFMEKEEKRTTLLEERVVEMEQAEARAEAAHARARGAIAVRMDKRPVPPLTRSFIDTHWERVLFYHTNKGDGERTDEYKQALADLETLIDASTGTIVELKDLVTSLNRQMDAQGYEKTERQEALQKLANELKVLQARARKAKEVGDAFVADVPPVESIPAAAPVEEKPVVRDEFDDIAAELATNSWFILRREVNGEAVRVKVKLVAIVKANGQHVFVSREGVKMLAVSRDEVAAKLRDGSLRLVETGQIFDRALESVIKSIRQQ